MPESVDSPRPQHLLTDRQRKLVGFALGFLALVVIIGLLALSFVVLARLVGIFSGVLWPITAAGIIALVLRPVVDALESKLDRPRVASVVILYALVAFVLTGLMLLVTPKLVEQVLDFIAFVPEFWQSALSFVKENYPDWIVLVEKQMANPHIKAVVDSALAEAQSLLTQALPSIKAAGSGAMNVFSFVTNLAIVPIYLFFFLLSRRDPTRSLGEQITFLEKPVRDDVVFLVREFIGIVVSFFRGQLMIGLIMGLLLTIGFAIMGLKFALVLGLTLGVLNIVPYLGTIIGLSIALPLAFFQPEGGWMLVGKVMVVFVIVQNIEGWFLTPKIMGERTGLHPVIIIFAIFFWGTAFDGILGMILAIPLTAFFVTAWRLAKHKYFER
ncbi:AI-2E family transporter [Synoicihabitans lomoniglobus]|uniref:AI-2E family transporter n=1 Tax=Synoicihabitans lomoniglobus TaxID=2909285 RepID=A0AAF0CS37_9BACT|nr:AI-2E family transporter [Opitutaceae bacterium LMO-M01]WED67016.1 AI-2E family transporter [Opitutaceae bacterium LMO-M01]